MLLLGGQIGQIHLGRLDTGVAKPLLQSIDGTATFEPIDGVDMAQIMEPERSEMLILFLGLDRHGLNDAAKVG
jgi:hypothetical protein